MSDLIQPRTLRGFRDFLPETMIPREAIIETAKRVFRSFGYSPIDTPALEYFEILAGKGSDETDRQMYQFEDHGKRKVGMRFDLTVPLARFAAQHIGQLGTPFKRYHIASVWRGENTQAGRYREFMQCDFDTIGSTSNASDIETALVIHDLMKAIGFERFTIRINHRQILNGLLTKLELAEYSVPILRAIDKLAKVPRESVVEEIVNATQADAAQVDRLMTFAELRGTNDDVLDQVTELVAGVEAGERGVAALRQLLETVQAAGADVERFQIDVSIARGLDYYTGTIYETFLDDLPKIGSVCSGGRYDNLAQLYTKQQLPGVGASLGLDRLLAAMDTLKLLPDSRTPADVLIVQFDRERLGDYLALATKLRRSGIAVEVYPDAKKLGAQFKYADRQGFQSVIVAGADEFEKNVVQLKWLESGQQVEVPIDDELQELARQIRGGADSAGCSG